MAKELFDFDRYYFMNRYKVFRVHPETTIRGSSAS